MIKLGEMQTLEIIRITKIGAFLNEHGEDDYDYDILLPLKQVPEGAEVGDEIKVFVYNDSEDRIIATTKIPKLTIGKLAKLKVVDTSKIGAFMDWGLDKDLLLPFKQQAYEVVKNGEYLVGLYLDKTDRLCASMNVLKFLSSQSPYKVNEWAIGTIYKITRDFGAFVAVDNKYDGLIPKKEFFGDYKNGDTVEVRIKKVLEDGKLELSVRKEAYNQIDEDANIIYTRLKANNGKLSLNDKSQPEDIKAELKMSKAAFKRAVGRLLKEGKIKILEDGITRA